MIAVAVAHAAALAAVAYVAGSSAVGACLDAGSDLGLHKGSEVEVHSPVVGSVAGGLEAEGVRNAEAGVREGRWEEGGDSAAAAGGVRAGSKAEVGRIGHLEEQNTAVGTGQGHHILLFREELLAVSFRLIFYGTLQLCSRG